MRKLFAALALAWTLAPALAAAQGISTPPTLPDNQYTHKNISNALTTGPGDASSYCPGPGQDATGAPGTAGAAGALWYSPCGIRTNLQNSTGFAVWAATPAGLPLDVIGAPVTVITLTGAGSGYATNDLLYFAHGTVGQVTGGSSTNPTVAVVTPGNWGCVGSTSQTGISQLGTNGSGSGATFTLTTPLPNAYGVKLLTHCYSGSAAVLQAVNGFTTEAAQTINFVSGNFDQATADGYCGGIAGSFTVNATWTGTTTTITLNSTLGQLVNGYSISGPGIASGTVISTVTSATAVTLNQNTTGSETAVTLLVTPPSTGDALTCYWTTWKDQGGLADDVTQSTLANAPVYLTKRQWNGSRPVVFNGVSRTPPTPATVWLGNSSLSWNWNNFTVVMVGRAKTQRMGEGLFQASSSTAKLYFAGSWNDKSCCSGLSNSTTTPCGFGPDDSISVFGISTTSSTVTCWNGSASQTLTGLSLNTALTGINIGPTTTTSGGFANISSGMDLLAAIFFPYKLSAAQQAAITAALANYFAVPLQYNDVVVWTGDSTGQQGSVSDSSFPHKAMAMGVRPARFLNMALYGITAQSLNQYETNGVCLAYSSYGANVKNFIIGLMAGPNDDRGGATAAQIESYLQTLVGTYNSCAPAAKIIAGVPMLQCDISNNSTEKATLIALNTWLEANYNIPQSQGGLGANGIADFWREPTVGGASGTSAMCGYPNADSLDGQHFPDYGQNFMAGVWAKAVSTYRH